MVAVVEWCGFLLGLIFLVLAHVLIEGYISLLP
jgi:hypothetical protein